MVMEPKYYAFRRWLDTPIIWEYDWIPSYRMPKTSGPLKLFLFNRENHDKFWDVRSETLRLFGVEGMVCFHVGILVIPNIEWLVFVCIQNMLAILIKSD